MNHLNETKRIWLKLRIFSWVNMLSGERKKFCCFSLCGTRGHLLSTYTKFSEKLIFLTPWYAHVRARVRGLEILVFSEIFAYVLNGWPHNRVFPLAFSFYEECVCHFSFKQNLTKVRWALYIWRVYLEIGDIIRTLMHNSSLYKKNFEALLRPHYLQ